MKSWTNWQPLNRQQVDLVPNHDMGVYAIRRTKNVKDLEPDIIYIGTSGIGNQGLGQRLKNLMRGLEMTDDKGASNNHSASPRIRNYIQDGLEFSWIKCFQAPDGIEKAMLLAFWTSTGQLPVCNTKF